MRIPKIQTVLYANAAFCLLSAVIVLLLSGVIAQYMINLPILVFTVLGAGLVLFALDVLYTARQQAPSRNKVLSILVADLAWVVLTPVVMVVLQDRITTLGNLLLADIALIVGAFATFEWLALGRMQAHR